MGNVPAGRPALLDSLRCPEAVVVRVGERVSRYCTGAMLIIGAGMMHAVDGVDVRLL